MAKGEKFHTDEVLPILLAIGTTFETEETMVKYDICGSIRREVELVSDVDIVVSDIIGFLRILQQLKAKRKWPKRSITVLTRKDLSEAKKCELKIKGYPFDLYLAESDHWGAMTLFLTGNHILNIAMRNEARKQGMKLNQYGLWHNETLIAAKTEEQIFYALGLKYLPPEDRSIRRNHKLIREG